jgi:hypothetical protein
MQADAQRLAESGLQPGEIEEKPTKQDPDTYSEIVPPVSSVAGDKAWN